MFGYWFSIQVLLSAFGLVATTGALRGCRGNNPAVNAAESLRWLVPVTLLLLLGMGWFAAELRGRNTDAELRQWVLGQAAAVGKTVDPDLVRRLEFSSGDRTNAAFQTIRQQMQAYAGAVGHRSLYSMALRNGSIVFGPENLAEGDAMASPPGTVYEEPGEQDWACLRQGKAAVFGPARRDAHTIKGAAGTVGASALSAAALEIERLARDNQLAAALHRVSRLPNESGRMQQALEQGGWWTPQTAPGAKPA